MVRMTAQFFSFRPWIIWAVERKIYQFVLTVPFSSHDGGHVDWIAEQGILGRVDDVTKDEVGQVRAHFRTLKVVKS